MNCQHIKSIELSIKNSNIMSQLTSDLSFKVNRFTWRIIELFKLFLIAIAWIDNM